MKTGTERDLFKNPFLGVAYSSFKEWKEAKGEGPWLDIFNYLIVSQTKDGPRRIVWFGSEDEDINSTVSQIEDSDSISLCEALGWREVFIWDAGAVGLMISDSEDDVVFRVGSNDEFINPNVYVSSPLLREAYLETEKFFKALPDTGSSLLVISFDELDENSLVPREEPIGHAK